MTTKECFSKKKTIVVFSFLRENSSSKCCGCAGKEAPETSGFQATGMFEGSVCYAFLTERHSSLTFPMWAIYFSIHVSR